MSRLCRRVLIPVGLLLVAHVACAAPHIFWASDPVRPGETVVVVGDGLTGAQVTVGDVSAAKLAAVSLIQPNDGSLKFTLPATLKPGLFQMAIKTPQGSVSHVLNRPVVWWAQVVNQPLTPGKAMLRVFGKNLTQNGVATVRLQASSNYDLRASGTAFALNAYLPFDLGGKQFPLTVDVGVGGKAGVSEPVSLTIPRPVVMPQKRFNVRDFGAEGQGTTDDTAAVKAAIEAAQKAGGGVVYFPRGRYQVNQTLEIPRLVTLRGERRDLVNILWPDVKDALPAQLKGTNSFAVEDLTFYTGNYSRFLVADDRQPDAGNVSLRRVTVRANRYRGHMTPEEVDRRLQTGGGNQCPLLTLGGVNVAITDCDLYSSGMVFWLTQLKNATIANNTLTNGRWGWYSLSGNDGVIFENNTIIGGDLMSTGGGLNTLDGSKVSRHVYYAGNTLRT
ncbi:MAG: glycosyl hydrolase family 28-related protein, partial [Armatimonadota bacterium]